MQNNTNDDVLQDGKRDWNGKKRRSMNVARHFSLGGREKKAEKVSGCADRLSFKQDSSGKLTLHQTWFCKSRLCPMCNWRRSMKIAYQNKLVVEKANERENLQWIFLTLTVRNTDAQELPETLSELSKGFYRLFKYKRVSGAVKGYFRALEVTRNADKDNPEWYGTYHPHYHVLIAVRPSYFKKAYIKQADWVALWRKAMRLDYDPVVHVQRVKPKAELDDMTSYEADVKRAIAEQKAILEVSKYPVKDSEVINPNQDESENVETLLTLDDALAFKRLIGYGGILKEIHAELNLDDAEEGNLLNVTEEDEIANAVFDITAKWHIGLNRYVVTKTARVTEEN